jgi:hypothetical protein
MLVYQICHYTDRVKLHIQPETTTTISLVSLRNVSTQIISQIYDGNDYKIYVTTILIH